MSLEKEFIGLMRGESLSKKRGLLCLRMEDFLVSREGISFSRGDGFFLSGVGISLSWEGNFIVSKGGIFLSKERSYPWTQEGRNFNVFEGGSSVTWFVVDLIWFIHGQ